MEDDYQSIIDEAEDEMDQAQDIIEGQSEQYGALAPEVKEQENLYNWFWKVVKLNKPLQIVRVGNLNNTEIGELNVSNRDALTLHHLGKTFGHPTFGNYFAQLAKITTATSMSRKGWFMDLSISQKRVRERSRASMSAPTKENKWRMFGKKKNQDPTV